MISAVKPEAKTTLAFWNFDAFFQCLQVTNDPGQLFFQQKQPLGFLRFWCHWFHYRLRMFCRQRRQNHPTAVTEAVKLLDECNGAMVARSIRQGKLYILCIYIYVHMKAKWKRNDNKMKALNKRNRLQMAAESLVLWWLGSLLGLLAPPSREWRPTRRALPCFAPVQSNFVTQLE